MLATSKPVPGKPVHTTIDPHLQQTAVAALGGQYGGVAVLDARNGSVLALAGIAFSGPQPPGSTFKLITTTAALEAGVVKLTDQFPIQTSTVVGGREVANAHNEACGGSFVEAFAESCNSVFVPLGPKLGSERLVDSGGAVRLQLAAQPVRPAGNSNRGPAPERHPGLDPQRPRARGERDRPGPGAGDAAGDGLGRAGDRQRRRAQPHADRDAIASCARRRVRCG